MKFITAHEAAEKLGIEYTQFTKFLKRGLVPEAHMEEGRWHVPSNVKKERQSYYRFYLED